MLRTELLLLCWLTLLGAATLSLCGASRALRAPSITLAPLVGVAVSAALMAVATALELPRLLWVTLLSGLVLGAVAVIDGLRRHRIAAMAVDAGTALAIALASALVMYPLIGPTFTNDSYYFILFGRQLPVGRLSLSSAAAADYPLLVVQLQALARGLRGEYTVYAAGVSGLLGIVGAVWIAAESVGSAARRGGTRMLATFVVVVAIVSIYMLRVQLTYLNSHLVAAALYALVVAATVWYADRARPPGTIVLVAVGLAGYSLARVEGLLVVAVLTVFVAYCIDLTARDTILLVTIGYAPPVIWYASLVIHGARGTILTPVRLVLLLAATGLALCLALVPALAPIRRTAPAVTVAILWLGLIGLTLVNRPDAPVSVSAFVLNAFVDGGWGPLWWIVAALGLALVIPWTGMTVDRRAQGDAATDLGRSVWHDAFVGPWLLVTIGYLLLVLSLGAIREFPFRLGWGDSGNRMLVHVVPTLLIYLVMRLTSEHDGRATGRVETTG